MSAEGRAELTRRRFIVSALAATLAACTPTAAGKRWGDELTPLYAWPARDEWPNAFREVPATTQAVYRYAVANREVLQYVPCFCGCVNGGHVSNYDCYVREERSGGGIRLDTHGFG